LIDQIQNGLNNTKLNTPRYLDMLNNQSDRFLLDQTNSNYSNTQNVVNLDNSTIINDNHKNHNHQNNINTH